MMSSSLNGVNIKNDVKSSPVEEHGPVKLNMMAESEVNTDVNMLGEDIDDVIDDDIDSAENLEVGETKTGSSEDMPDGLTGYKVKKVLKHDFTRDIAEPLPDGWIVVTHSCGLPIYMHKKTRVVTWSRPYSLMSGSVAKHKIPVQSIPCLHYVQTKQKLANDYGKCAVDSEIDGVSNKDRELGTEKAEGPNMPKSQPKVILHHQEDISIGEDELSEYLEKRFEFEVIKIPQFRKWSQRRDYNRNMRRKKLEEANNTTLENSESTVATPNLITLTVEQDDGTGNSARNKKFVLNTTGKPMICILHEYAQRVLRVQPHYVFNIREESSEPFEASIMLNGTAYGKAVAINKKTAKNKAALATLEMLIPGFKGQVESNQGNPNMQCFNEVSITDSRVHELCVHTGQLLPYQLLTECLKRHQGVADTNVTYDVQQGKRRSLNYTMVCGKHFATGTAKNKKIGKQLAAQQILQFLHPEVKTWAELIKLYGTSLAQERARRKQEEQEIFDLKQKKNDIDDNDSDNPESGVPGEDKNLEPNPELLAKLRDMMFKLEETRNKRSCEIEEMSSLKKMKLTPMGAAIAAGKGLTESDNELMLSDSEKSSAS